MLNFCHVSLLRDIPIILENYISLYVWKMKFIFLKKLESVEFNLIDEDSIISLKDFSEILKK